VEIKGKEELIRRFISSPQLIQKHFVPAMQKSVHLLEGEIKKNTPVGVAGQLRSSIGTEVKSLGGGVRGIVGSPLSYAPYVEEGTKPHFPPVSALERWCELKLGDRRLAFVVARAISRRGTKAVKMFERGVEAKKEEVFAFFRQALINLVRDLGEGL